MKSDLPFWPTIAKILCLVILMPALMAAVPVVAQAELHPSLSHLKDFLGPKDGVIRGDVLSGETGELLPAATIAALAPETGEVVKGVIASLDGDYELIIAEGTYNLKVSYIGYTGTTVSNVKVVAGQPTKIDPILEPEGLQGEEILVEARVVENTDQALLIRQQRAPVVSDAISAEQIARTPDSNSADALKRMTGVSVVGDKYVYVRGLGERYSSTQLNGARVTSTESKRVVALDMIPAKLVDNVITQKTYTADQWGEFAGGVVQVNTKDFPEELTVEFGNSLGGQEGSNFASSRTYPGGSRDWLGYDDGRRDLPDLVKELAGDQPIVPRGRFGTEGFTPEEIQALGRSFENVWEPRQHKSGINQGYNLSIGNKANILGRSLGYVGSLTYGGNFDEKDELRRAYSVGSSGLVPYSDYTSRSSIYAVDIGALLNLTMRVSPYHQVSFRNTYARNADDEIRLYEGISPNFDRDQPIRSQRLRWVERSTFATRLEGQHLLSKSAQLQMTWQLGGSTASRYEPDNRETIYVFDPVDQEWRLWDNGQSGQRFFSIQDDEEVTAEAGFGLPLPAWGWKSGQLKAGGFWSNRNRDFLARRFRYVPRRGVQAGVDLTLPAEEIYVPENIAPGLFELQELTRPTDRYIGRQVIAGGYVSADLSLASWLRVIPGLRVEDSTQRIMSGVNGAPDSIQTEVVAETEPMPSLSAVLKLDDKTNLRFGLSRTVNRPDFRELSPFEFTEFVGGRSEKGNPELVHAKIRNYDVRLERFPALSQVQAISIFYKSFTDPIETIVQGGEGRTIEYINAPDARNYGFEIELRQPLADVVSNLAFPWREQVKERLDAPLAWFTAGVNWTVVASDVDVSATGVQTSKKRPLQGQSPYVVNTSLTCAFPDLRSEVSGLYNVFGKRISEVGIQEQPDVYEQPRHTIDLAASTHFNHHIKMKFAAKNLLNHDYRFTQGNEIYYLYNAGRTFSLSFTYGL